MGVLDVDDNIKSNKGLFIDILTDRDLFDKESDCIYKYLSDEYTQIKIDNLFDELCSFDYLLLIKKFNNKIGISIYGTKEVIDIGYNTYIHDDIWECDIHKYRYIYDDIKSVYSNPQYKGYRGGYDIKIYKIDCDIFNMIYNKINR